VKSSGTLAIGVNPLVVALPARDTPVWLITDRTSGLRLPPMATVVAGISNGRLTSIPAVRFAGDERLLWVETRNSN
jgi:hypothetical protein